VAARELRAGQLVGQVRPLGLDGLGAPDVVQRRGQQQFVVRPGPRGEPAGLQGVRALVHGLAAVRGPAEAVDQGGRRLAGEGGSFRIVSASSSASSRVAAATPDPLRAVSSDALRVVPADAAGATRVPCLHPTGGVPSR
jgi:hypothetical protein